MKNGLYIYFFAFVLAIFCSCKSGNNSGRVPVHSKKSIAVTSLEVDSLLLNPPVFSGNGFFRISEDSIYFLDKLYATLSIFDKEGKFRKRYLGRGEGPGEVTRVHKLLNLKDGRHLLVGDFYYTIFGQNWQKLATRQIDWQYGKMNKNALLNNPDPSLSAMYGFNWMAIDNPCLVERSNGRLVIPISCEHPKMNAFQDEEYYREARIFAELELSTGKILEIFGRRSPEYLNHQFIPNFDFYHFANISHDSLVVSFAIDSLMYVYDNSNNLIKKFGVSGINMRTDYPETNGNFEAVEADFKREMQTYGYYNYLYYDSTNQFVFRSYRKGGDAKTAGLQIYDQHKNLIADLDVPHNFKVVGYITPYYYASGIIDELNNRLGIYRFKLND